MTRLIAADVQANGIAHLRMQDAARKNVLHGEFIQEFLAGLDQVETGSRTKVLILSGLPEVFCGGAGKQDLLDICDGRFQVKDLLLSERLLDAPFPVIAAMEGHAVGGGLMLAACSDMVLAARESRYGAVFMSLGFTPGMGCTQLLEELMGPFLAQEMMYTAKCFKGRELEQRRTRINYILPRAEVMPQAENMALQISEKSLQSITLLKAALAAKKKALLASARIQEDRMHRVLFADPETRRRIQEMYGE